MCSSDLYISAQVIIDECRGLRKNDAKFYAALDTALERENRYDRQDFDRHIRNLPEERLYELISYFLYSIGARDNDKASFCAAGRGQMKAGTQLGTFLLE